MITNAFCMTASNILEIHTHVLLVVLWLADTCYCEAL